MRPHARPHRNCERIPTSRPVRVWRRPCYRRCGHVPDGSPRHHESSSGRVQRDARTAVDASTGVSSLGNRAVCVSGHRGRTRALRVSAVDAERDHCQSRRLTETYLSSVASIPTECHSSHRRRPCQLARCSRATRWTACTTRCSTMPGSRARICRPLFEDLRAASLAELAAAPAGSRHGVPDPGHHVHRLRRRAGHRADLPVRPAAADHHRRRMAARSSAG